MDAELIPVNILDDQNYKYSRRQWMNAGIDQHTRPPSQNPDMLELATNVLPPITNSWQRRYGYRLYLPQLEQGVGTSGEQSNSVLYGVGLNGVTGYVNTSLAISLALGASLSIEFWFETTSTLGGSFVSMANDQNPTSGETTAINVYLNTDGTVGAEYLNSNSSGTIQTSTLPYNDGNLHYVAFTINGSTSTLYVDGVVVSASSTYTLAAITSNYWRLGDSDGSLGEAGYLQTFLSHVAIYPFALSQTQVTADYQALVGPNGSQANYESVVKGNVPSYFWYLTEIAVVTPQTSPTVVQKIAVGLGAGPYTVTLPGATTLGNTILLVFDKLSTNTISSVTDNLSNSYSAITGATGIYAYFAVVANPGSTTITIAITGNPTTDVQILAQELGGLASSGVLDSTTPTDTVGPRTTTHSTPVLTTTFSPDIVFSAVEVAGSAGTTVASTGPGWTTINSFDVFAVGLLAISLAYSFASQTGTFSDSWVASTASSWQSMTFALKQAASAATGTIAYDYVGRDNGQYESSNPVPNNIVQAAPSAASSFTVTVATPSPAIRSGDTGFLMVNMDPTPGGGSGSVISGITDSAGNTWFALTPSLTYTDSHSRTSNMQVWSVGMVAQIPTTGTLTITVTTTTEITPVFTFFNVPDLLSVDQSASAKGTGATGNSGSATTTKNEMFLSFCASSVSISSAPSGFTEFAGSAAGANNAQVAYIFEQGTVTDTWSFASSSNWAIALETFPLFLGYSLGESVNT